MAWEARTCAALTIVAALTAANASAQPTQQEAQRQAYGHSLSCFVANSHAMGISKRGGDAAKMAHYERKARLSFDNAVRLGKALGYSGTRVDQDFGIVQARELPPMVNDEAYFLKTAATCKALGLM